MAAIELHLTATISHPSRQLRATGERSGSAVLLYAGGSVDACNVAVWRQLLDQAAQATWTSGALIVDTSRLEFMGCCAFVALAEESARCRRRGIRLCLVGGRGIAARVVAAGGLQAELPLYSNVKAALDDEHHPLATITTTTGAQWPVKPRPETTTTTFTAMRTSANCADR